MAIAFDQQQLLLGAGRSSLQLKCCKILIASPFFEPNAINKDIATGPHCCTRRIRDVLLPYKKLSLPICWRQHLLLLLPPPLFLQHFCCAVLLLGYFN